MDDEAAMFKITISRSVRHLEMAIWKGYLHWFLGGIVLLGNSIDYCVLAGIWRLLGRRIGVIGVHVVSVIGS